MKLWIMKHHTPYTYTSEIMKRAAVRARGRLSEQGVGDHEEGGCQSRHERLEEAISTQS
jgi:hypothetical protein